MIITNINEGEKADYSFRGTSLTIGTVTIELQQRQIDSQNVIDICLDNQLQTMREGLGAWYVANIIIPPKQHEIVPTGETDSDGNDVMKEQEIPLDMSKIELRLWGLPKEYGQAPAEEGVTE
jgi:hypothetical protein